jgi:hypothetical protein
VDTWSCRQAGDATCGSSPECQSGYRYRDATVESGARYSCAVAAVDRQTPAPSISVPSAPVDEVAR